MKRISRITVLLIVCFVFAASGAVFAGEKKIVVGGKNYTEQYILPEIAGILLEEAGFDVELKTGVASSLLRKALENEQVDMYFEYTGTGYTLYYKQSDRDIMTDPDKIYDWVKRKDAAKDIIWLPRIRFNNTYTLMFRKTDAQRLGIETTSELAAYVNDNPKDLDFAMSAEDWERPDGFRGVMKTYKFRVKPNKVRKMGTGLVYMAMRESKVDCAIGYSTDGRIAAFDLVNLEDDLNFFPVYNPAPTIRRDVLEKYPEIEEILAPIDDNLTTEEMQKLNAEVTIEHVPARDAAMSWLKSKDLVK